MNRRVYKHLHTFGGHFIDGKEVIYLIFYMMGANSHFAGTARSYFREKQLKQKFIKALGFLNHVRTMNK
jgi:predicted GIY-YIG superfamily endonuclease